MTSIEDKEFHCAIEMLRSGYWKEIVVMQRNHVTSNTRFLGSAFLLLLGKKYLFGELPADNHHLTPPH
jgi:hypothetical protein